MSDIVDAGPAGTLGSMRYAARTVARLLIASLAVAVACIAAPQVAWAHTDFDYSVPTDGAAVGEPVDEVTVAFTEEVTLVGPGFEVLNPQGAVLQPFAVTDDDIVFRLQFDPPLGGGVVAVMYEVAAADGHVLDGNFTFTVAADAPTVTEPPVTEPPVTEPPVTEPPVTEPPVTEPPATTSPTTEPALVEPSATAPTVPATDVPVDEAPADSAPGTTSGPPDETGAVDAEGDSGGSSTTLVPVGLGAIAAGALAFVLVRSRTGR